MQNTTVRYKLLKMKTVPKVYSKFLIKYPRSKF